MRDFNMKHSVITVSLAARDYPRALHSISSDDEQSKIAGLQRQVEILTAALDQTDSTVELSLVEPLPDSDQVERFDQLVQDIRGSISLRSCADLTVAYGAKDSWMDLSDLQVRVTASELINKFNREGVEPPSMWYSLV